MRAEPAAALLAPGTLETMCAELGALVRCESPSDDLAAVARGADAVAALGEAHLGTGPERIVVDGRTHLRWRFGEDRTDRVLLLGHQDTVWPVGSLDVHPWRVEQGRAYGPGCFDMKAGLVQLFHAAAALPDRRGLSILVTGDEELGAPSSRDLLAEEAGACAATLVFEASADGGALKTARRGVSRYELQVTGRAAHAGLEPWNGVNATVELARQVLAVAALDAGPAGSTVTPTLMRGGTSANTVPADASLRVDVRSVTLEDQRTVHAAMRALRPHDPDALLELLGGPSHPPLEPSSTLALYALAVEVAGGLGLPAPDQARVGGASDGNLAAAAGSAVLDGMGAVGGGAHAATEHVVVAEMPRRAALAAAVVGRLLAGATPERAG